jgi:hypothetical protein
VNAFVYAMALDENDVSKHDKLVALKLTPNEWERVELFLVLLAVRFFHLPFFASPDACYLARRQSPASFFIRSDVNTSSGHTRARGAL